MAEEPLDFRKFASESDELPDFSSQATQPDFSAQAVSRMERLAASAKRIRDEALAGAEGSIATTGFGFRADTDKFFSDLGIIGPKPEDSAAVAALKIANRGLLETPTRAMDAAMAGMQGALRGIGQIAKEFGADESGVNRAIRDVNTFLLSRMGEGAAAIPTAPLKNRVLKQIPKKNAAEADAALEAALGRFAQSIGVDADALAAKSVMTRQEVLINKILDDTYFARVIEKRAGDTTRKVEPPNAEPPTTPGREVAKPYAGPGARLLENRPGPFILEMEQGFGGEFVLKQPRPSPDVGEFRPGPPGKPPKGPAGLLEGPEPPFVGPPATPRGHKLRPALELRLLKGLPQLIEQVYERGPIMRDVRGNIRHTGTPGLNAILNQVGKENLPNLMLYFAARGVENIRRTRPTVELPTGMDSSTVGKVLELGQRNPAFEKAYREYQIFNREVLNLQVDSGVLSPAQRDAFVNARLDYTPMYRVVEEALSGRAKSATAVLRSLRGGPQNVAEIANNLFLNAQMHVELAMRNYAKRDLYDLIDQAGLREFAQPIPRDVRMGKALPGDIAKLVEGLPEDLAVFLRTQAERAGVHAAVPGKPRGENVDVVYRNGKAHYYRINDPVMAESLFAWGPSAYPSAVALAGGFKTAFTRLVTAMPPFVVKNGTRDTVSAYVNFPAEYGMFVPVIDTLRGLWSVMTKDKTYQEAMINGVGFSTLFKGERLIERQASTRKFYESHGIKSSRLIDTAEKFAHLLEEGVSALEISTRVRTFEKVAGKTGDLRRGGFEAREISTDFGKTGADANVRLAIRIIPFLNPAIQGIEKSARTIGQHPLRTMTRGVMLMTIPTLLLWDMNKDDPDYQALPNFVKDLNWAIPDNFYLPDVPKTGYYLIPRPFEYGAIFASTPEQFMNYLETRHGSRFAKAMLDIVTQQLRVSVVPQIVAPLADQALNRQFPDRPIVPENLKDVRPSEQFTPYTAKTLIELSRVLREDTGVELSPARVEAMIQGYLGTFGAYLLDAAEAAEGLFAKGERPERRLDERPMLRNFLIELPLKQSQFGADFYELQSAAKMQLATLRKLVQEARNPDLTAQEERLAALSQSADQLAGNIAQLNAEVRRVYGSETMSGKAKRQELDKLYAARNDLFRAFVEGAPEDVSEDLGLPKKPKLDFLKQ